MAADSHDHKSGCCCAKTGARCQRSSVSSKRRALAQGVNASEVICLEAADDAEGFRFWLALAVGPAFVYRGRGQTKDGVRLRHGFYYVTLRIYDRFPPRLTL